MKIEEFDLVECETIPTNIDDGKLYYSRKYGTATHLCACGCGSKVVTPCKPGFWDMKILDGKPTLSPSIGNFQLPCKSHYFIRDGKVIWC